MHPRPPLVRGPDAQGGGGGRGSRPAAHFLLQRTVGSAPCAQDPQCNWAPTRASCSLATNSRSRSARPLGARGWPEPAGAAAPGAGSGEGAGPCAAGFRRPPLLLPSAHRADSPLRGPPAPASPRAAEPAPRRGCGERAARRARCPQPQHSSHFLKSPFTLLTCCRPRSAVGCDSLASVGCAVSPPFRGGIAAAIGAVSDFGRARAALRPAGRWLAGQHRHLVLVVSMCEPARRPAG